jgi:FkbM family methyltransferase
MNTLHDKHGDAALYGELERLLSERVEGAAERERTSFQRCTQPFQASLVLFGAGGLGRRTLAGLRKLQIEPLAFSDNNPRLWGTTVDGLAVLEPAEAARRYADKAAFVITIWSGQATDRMANRQRQLRTLGCQKILTFGPLYWKFPAIFLPHYSADLPQKVHEQAESVLRAFHLWADQDSRREYVAQVRWRLLADFDGLADPVSHPIYFPFDLCKLRDDEVFVDCGAFDGDTLRSFFSESREAFHKVVAFEPDPVNFVRLRQYVEALPGRMRDSIRIRQAAVGARSGVVSFSATGAEDAAVGSGEAEVECDSLDEALEGCAPTYIKMDIEGAELDALAGARTTIREHAPVLAVCSYHRQDHLWRIPLLIHECHPGYRFFLRPHLREVWDLVCYAVPAGRWLSGDSGA